MRIVTKGWFTYREMDRSEAEAYHLREAAALVGDPRQGHHLAEAAANRAWAGRP